MKTYLLDKTEKLLKTHPNVVIFVIACCIGTLMAGLSLADEQFAKRVDLDRKYQFLQEQIAGVERKVNSVESGLNQLQMQGTINSLVQQIATLDAQIYQLERLEADGEANSRDRERLVMLRSEQVELTRQLNALYAQ